VVPFARHVPPKLPVLQASAAMSALRTHSERPKPQPSIVKPPPFEVNRDAMSKEVRDWAHRVCKATNPFQVRSPTPISLDTIVARTHMYTYAPRV
jgi:hypothetical protein